MSPRRGRIPLQDLLAQTRQSRAPRHSSTIRGRLRRLGLSMVEIVVAFTFLAVVVLFLIELYPSSFLAQSEARNRVHASQQVESILDACSSLPLHSLISDGTASVRYDVATPGPLPRELVEVKTESDTKLSPSLLIERKETNDNGRTILVRVLAQVRWQRSHGGDMILQREAWFSDVAR